MAKKRTDPRVKVPKLVRIERRKSKRKKKIEAKLIGRGKR